MNFEQKNVLTEANEVVNGPRREAYGDPYDNNLVTAKLFSAYLGVEIKPSDIPILLILFKISREKNRHQRDNVVDIAGYAWVLEQVIAKMNKD